MIIKATLKGVAFFDTAFLFFIFKKGKRICKSNLITPAGEIDLEHYQN
jgi:hypothetical protein